MTPRAMKRIEAISVEGDYNLMSGEVRPRANTQPLALFPRGRPVGDSLELSAKTEFHTKSG
jgi:hypothetical protein